MLAKILAIAIFLVMFVMIILDKFPKHYVTLIAGAATLVLVFGLGMQLDNRFLNGDYNSVRSILDTLNFRSIFTSEFWYTHGESASKGISWSTIFFLAGMMVMVEGMARVGFFRWLCMRIAKAVNYKTIPVFIVFMVVSAFLAMFIDSITVILFLAAVTIELSQLLKFNPVPMILAEVFCANLGGSATMCGDPPNIIIGTAFGYSFTDFLTHTGFIAAISLVFIVLYFFLVFKKDLKTPEGVTIDISAIPAPKTAILDKKGFVVSIIIFLIAIALLVTHAQSGLTVSTIGIGIATITILTTAIIAGGKGLKEIFVRVDYKTLLFFTGLFIVVGGLEETGILEIIAGFIEKVSGGNPYVMLAIIIWVSAVASAFIDNIPFAATMVPVIQSLSAVSGIPLTTLAWGLAMGTDIGGSATPIGASANVVGISAANAAGHKVSWGYYCRKAVPATVIVLALSTLIIFLRYL
ncbi:MAG: anion permease [Treponemataceae bacterium]|nr:anion permease [Treponemataceae bacterium]